MTLLWGATALVPEPEEEITPEVFYSMQNVQTLAAANRIVGRSATLSNSGEPFGYVATWGGGLGGSARIIAILGESQNIQWSGYTGRTAGRHGARLDLE